MNTAHSDHEDAKQVADQLCQATLAIESVDYNAVLTDEEIHTLLRAKADIRAVCLHHRSTERAQRDTDADTNEGDCTDE